MRSSNKNNKASRGVTMMAFGKPIFYEFAFNMLLSIKKHSADLPIQLIHDGNLKELSGREGMFDILTRIKRDDYIDGNKLQAGLAKCSMYDYLAFEETMYLDVDGLILKDITELFDQEEDFKIQKDEMHWVKSEEKLGKHFGIKEAIGCNSSMMFIRKGELTQNLFYLAKKEINNPLNKIDNGWFGMHPDELYLGVAMVKLNIEKPYFDFPYPIYLRRRIDYKGETFFKNIKINHHGIGVYGNKLYNHSICYRLYDYENIQNWNNIIGKNPRIKVDKLMRLKR